MINRRQIMQLGVSALALQGAARSAAADAPAGHLPLIQRAIPSSKEQLPVIGMGTSRTFDTEGDSESVSQLSDILQLFFAVEGRIIDSSPMYGRAESRVGDVLRKLPQPPKLFAATKVWTTGREEGIAQMEQSARRMNVERFDLIAVHNLQDWRTHLDTLRNWQAEGRVRYIGITTSHGRDHEQFLEVMRTQPLDFVQFSYNIEDRVAEQKLLPLARDRGIATMLNRPFQRGSIFARTRGKPLPAIAQEIDCTSWGQFFLKFIIGHPAATCVIPATSKIEHMRDNMQANFGRVPDATQRQAMLQAFNSL